MMPAHTNGALRLAQWIVASQPRISHLKLQKLVFYGYGAACAFNFVDELGGPVTFNAWKHGPVSPVVYAAFKPWGSDEIVPEGDDHPVFAFETENHLADVLTIYGSLSAWQLRQQSHFERPWLDTFRGESIDDDAIHRHFVSIYRENVEIPEVLGRTSSFLLDGLPAARFDSLRHLASDLRDS